MKSSLLIFVCSIIFRIDAQAPPDSQGYVKIADSLYATGNYTKAINYYAEVEGENSGLQIARAYNAIGNLEKAILQYQSVVEQHPDWQIPRFEVGKLLLKTKAYDEARKLFSQLTGPGKRQPRIPLLSRRNLSRARPTRQCLDRLQKSGEIGQHTFAQSVPIGQILYD